MKRLISIVLAITMLMSLTACKSKAAQNVDDLIAAIGEVNITSDRAIIHAEQALEALEDKEKEQVEGKDILIAARTQYTQLILEQEADKIEEVIDSIGEVSMDSKDELEAARKKYSVAKADVKPLVKNLSKLEAAEEKYADLCAAEAIKRINAIGTVTLNSKNAIDAAQAYYDDLNALSKRKVSNYSDLKKAKDTLTSLKKNEAKQILNTMHVEIDNIYDSKFYYPKVVPDYAFTRTYIMPYLGTSGGSYWLCARYHYTNNNWVFFDKIIVNADGKNYTKTFNYFDATHNVGGGAVAEYYNVSTVTQSDIEMFWAIANSNKAVVRFEGDDFYFDLTVSAKDKQGIRDILTAYEALS